LEITGPHFTNLGGKKRLAPIDGFVAIAANFTAKEKRNGGMLRLLPFGGDQPYQVIY
jgi:hypothetical protein